MNRQFTIRIFLCGLLLAFSAGNVALAQGRAFIIPKEQYDRELAEADKKSRIQLAAARRLPKGSLARAQALIDCVRGITNYHAIDDEKESAIKEALDIRQKRLPANDLRTADAEYELGNFYTRMQFERDKSKKCYLRAIPGFEHHLDKVMVSAALNRELQDMYIATGQGQKIRSLTNEQYKRSQTNKAIDRASLMGGLTKVICASEVAKDYKQAEVDLRKYLELAGESSASHDLAKMHIRLGLAIQNQGRLNDALAEFNKALDIDEKVFPNRQSLVCNHILSGLPDDTSPIVEDLVLIGDLYTKQGKQAEARTSFNQAWDILKDMKDNGVSPPFTHQITYVKQRCTELAAGH